MEEMEQRLAQMASLGLIPYSSSATEHEIRSYEATDKLRPYTEIAIVIERRIRHEEERWLDGFGGADTTEEEWNPRRHSDAWQYFFQDELVNRLCEPTDKATLEQMYARVEALWMLENPELARGWKPVAGSELLERYKAEFASSVGPKVETPLQEQ